MIFGHDIQFWITVGIAAAIKWLFSTYQSWRVSIASLCTAIFIPWLFTPAVMDWMGLEPEIYTLPTAGLLAWSGEQLIKGLMAMDLKSVVSAIKGGLK